MRPNLRQLEVLRTFARVQNVTETAKLLRISQPAVSQTLKELEGLLGLELLDRRGRRVRLSDTASALMTDVHAVLDRVDALCDAAAVLQGARSAHLAIATAPSLAIDILPDVLKRLRDTLPGGIFRVESFSSTDVGRRVAEKRSDVGLTFLPVDPAGLTIQPLLQTQIVCLLPDAHPLAERRMLGLRDLASERLITLGDQARREFDCRLLFPDKPEADFLDTNDATVSLGLVRHGLGVALALPFVLAGNTMPGITCVPFEPSVTRTLSLIRSPVAPATDISTVFLTELRQRLRGFAQWLRARGIAARLYG